MISDRSNPIGAVVALQVDGVVVVRHGTLVYERYFRGYNADEVHIIQSVTKSVVALLVGIAVDHGWLRCRRATFDRKTRIALRFEIF